MMLRSAAQNVGSAVRARTNWSKATNSAGRPPPRRALVKPRPNDMKTGTAMNTIMRIAAGSTKR